MRRDRLLLYLFFFLTILLTKTGAVFAGQEVWMVDLYGADWTCASEEEYGKLRTYRLEKKSQCCAGHWIKSDQEEFLETSDPDVPIIIFVPGYTSTPQQTVEVGMMLVQHFDSEKSGRTVFWNWPSEKQSSWLATDIRAKMPVASASSDYLVRFLRTLKPNSKVCIFGFSFGNRIVLDAVERLGDDQPEGLRIRLVLAGAATDRNFLARNHRNGHVPEIAEKILIFFNPLDRALLVYPLIYGTDYKPEALGRYGPPLGAILPQFRNRIESVDVFSQVGVRHITAVSMGAPAFKQRIGTYFFFEGERDVPQHIPAYDAPQYAGEKQQAPEPFANLGQNLTK